MMNLLYKVSPLRDELTFEPRPFWRAEDWSFSDDHPHDGLIEDHVLYAAQFDEINIHLLPRVWRLRVWLDDEERCRKLKQLGFVWKAGSRAVIFALEADREAIESFLPTVYVFDRAGFQRTPTDEFVSREPRKAISAETVPFHEARQRWQFDLLYVTNSEELIQSLRLVGVDHQIQT